LSATRVIRLTLEYDGGAYHGWQEQRGLVTVQGEVRRHLRTLLREPVTVIGAGRTDAGVHALGQVASFRTQDMAMPLGRMKRSLNALLGHSASVVAIAEEGDGFDARRSARGRRYLYLIATRPSPLWRDRVWVVTMPLSLEAMKVASGALPGRHDFTAFAATGGAPRGAVCTILRARWSRWRLGYRLDIEANRFLHHMVRSLVGTMVEAGRGKIAPSAMADLLVNRERQLAGPTAPACGLYLAEVIY
jgi:tRNA pseudouridine38-40 synthase